MSELTNKRLEIIRERLRNEDPDGRPNLRTEATIEIIDELLTLRSLRDAGDEDFREKLEQVDDWIGKVPVAHLDSVFERDARIALSEMEKMYITRGQQLREAREEIERLKGERVDREQDVERVNDVAQNLLSFMLTCKKDNTPDWMDYLAEKMNEALVKLEDEDRVFHHRGEIFKKGNP